MSFLQPAVAAPAEGTLVTASATSATTLVTLDATGFSTLVFQITSGGSGNTLVVETSSDGTTWSPLPIASPTGATAVFQNTTAGATSGMYGAPVLLRWMRIRCSIYGSGTIAVSAQLRPTSFLSPTIGQGPAAGAASAWTTRLTPMANSGQLTHQRVTSAASTNATSVKASQGNVFGWTLSNTSASVRFFKLYSKASAPTVGTDTPVLTILLPAGQTVSFQTPVGVSATQNGIAYAITSAAADSDTTAVTAGDVTGALWYL